MSVLSRVSAPAATHDVAGVIVALFSNPDRAARETFLSKQNPNWTRMETSQPSPS